MEHENTSKASADPESFVSGFMCGSRGGPMMARLLWYLDPSYPHQLKTKTKKVVKGGPLLAKLSGSGHGVPALTTFFFFFSFLSSTYFTERRGRPMTSPGGSVLVFRRKLSIQLKVCHQPPSS